MFVSIYVVRFKGMQWVREFDLNLNMIKQNE